MYGDHSARLTKRRQHRVSNLLSDDFFALLGQMYAIVTDHVLDPHFQGDHVNIVSQNTTILGNFRGPYVVASDVSIVSHDAFVCLGGSLALFVNRGGQREGDLGVGQRLESGEDLPKIRGIEFEAVPGLTGLGVQKEIVQPDVDVDNRGVCDP